MAGLLKPRFGVLVLVALLLTVAAPDSSAVTVLWGTTGSGGSGSTLVQLDPDTGAWIQTIGLIGYTVNGLTWDPIAGRLLASTSATDPIYNGLIEIDPVTGAGTEIGTDGWGFGIATAVTNITINSLGQLYGWMEGPDNLVSIDALGVATEVGPSGLSTFSNGLSFDPTNVLHMMNFDGQYYVVDTLTGATSLAGDIGLIAHHGDFHPDQGYYWGIDTNFGATRNIVVADLATGSIVDTLSTVNNLHTLTFGDVAVPEPGTMVLIGLGLVGMAAGRIRRS